MVPAVASAVIAMTVIAVSTIITAAVARVATIVSRANTNNDPWTIIPRIHHRRRSSVNDSWRGDVGDWRGRINDRGGSSVNRWRHIGRSR
jgi:hypothetical protein